MHPFVMGSVDDVSCFDESSPCLEEQAAYCVLDIVKTDDSSSKFPGQDKYVPWQVCVSQGNSKSTCYNNVGVSESDVSDCLNDSSRMSTLIQAALDVKNSYGVPHTPYELVAGNEVDSSYSDVKSAICAADSSLSACSGSPTPTPTHSPVPTPTPAPTPPAPTPTPTPVPSPTPGCVDVSSSSSCSYWKDAGYCASSSEYHSYMEENCCATCGFGVSEMQV